MISTIPPHGEARGRVACRVLPEGTTTAERALCVGCRWPRLLTMPPRACERDTGHSARGIHFEYRHINAAIAAAAAVVFGADTLPHRILKRVLVYT